MFCQSPLGLALVPVRISSSPHGSKAVGTALGGYRRNGESPVRLLPHSPLPKFINTNTRLSVRLSSKFPYNHSAHSNPLRAQRFVKLRKHDHSVFDLLPSVPFVEHRLCLLHGFIHEATGRGRSSNKTVHRARQSARFTSHL